MTLAQTVGEYVAAGFSGLWLRTFEPDEAIRELAELAREAVYDFSVWDVSNGLVSVSDKSTAVKAGALQFLNAEMAKGQTARNGPGSITVLRHFNRFLVAETIQALEHVLFRGKANARFYIIMTVPSVTVPTELEKMFLVIDHDLPDRKQLLAVAEGVADKDELPSGEELDKVLEAAAGLTRYEAEGAYSMALARHGKVSADTVWELKMQSIRRSGLLTIHRGGESFNDLEGMQNLKEFCMSILTPNRNRPAEAKPRGVLLLGVQGTGKSAFCKALGNATGRLTACMDIGSLMGRYLGESEHNIRHALQIADAMAPCILFVDEVERALAGIGSESNGVVDRMFGTLLTWLNDHETDVFFVATSNDISKLPPQFTRAERFDAVFFIDLPTKAVRDSLWGLYGRKFSVGTDDVDEEVACEDWTGAEIRACCRLAALLQCDVKTASKNVVPIAQTAKEQIAALQEWATGRCLSAETGGLYVHTQTANGVVTAGRRIRKKG